jgi:uncharacterized protein YlxW (UPF0749 family)
MPRTTTRQTTRSDPPDTPRPDLPDQVVMPLLDRIVRQSLDEDYQVAAARKAHSRQAASGNRPPTAPTPSGRPRQVAAAVMAVFGVIVAIAAVQTSRNAPEANASRASLIEQIQARRDNVAALQQRLERLRNSTTDLRAALAQAEADGQVLSARIERLEARTGLAPVSGAGLRITVDDAPDGDVTQQVRDSDLAILVDGLWNAGAEAISVNGKRLTNLTAFDNVGPAIHIGIMPLSPPYTILVVGDPDTLAADLLESTFGQQWYSLVDSLGFVFDTKRESVTLPASRPRLRTVRLLTDQDPNRPADNSQGSAP